MKRINYSINLDKMTKEELIKLNKRLSHNISERTYYTSKHVEGTRKYTIYQGAIKKGWLKGKNKRELKLQKNVNKKRFSNLDIRTMRNIIRAKQNWLNKQTATTTGLKKSIKDINDLVNPHHQKITSNQRKEIFKLYRMVVEEYPNVFYKTNEGRRKNSPRLLERASEIVAENDDIETRISKMRAFVNSVYEDETEAEEAFNEYMK